MNSNSSAFNGKLETYNDSEIFYSPQAEVSPNELNKQKKTISNIGNKTTGTKLNPTTTTVGKSDLGTFSSNKMLTKPADNKSIQFKDNTTKSTKKVQSTLLSFVKQDDVIANSGKMSLNMAAYKDLEANKIRNNLQSMDEKTSKYGGKSAK